MKHNIRKSVREGYAKIAETGGSCCGPSSSCCGSQGESMSRAVGYTEGELKSVPGGADLGLGCGNPVAMASIKKGETVLDLGSGPGLDCFLASKRVGRTGRVIGVDMTPQMLDRARENARKGGYTNVEFRLGEIENLPAADNCADIVISNCVINLSTDKPRVFREAFRVLKPGGRLMVSDIVLLKNLPARVRNSVASYIGCLSGAMMKKAYLEAIRRAGFEKIEVPGEDSFPLDLIANDPSAKALMAEMKLSAREIKEAGSSVLSIRVSAVKPERRNLRAALKTH
jgi:arsenite methyltransferase